MVFWGSLGVILGALGALLGALLMLLLAFGSTLNSQNFLLASLPGQIACFFSPLLSLPSSKSLFSSSWSLLVSNLSSQATLRPSKTMVLWRRELDFRKIKVWDLKMLLMVFWGSLGPVLGALGGFLGALLVLLRALGGTLHFQNFLFGLP